MKLKLSKIYKTHGALNVLNDISFVLDRGQKVGLVGCNGTGKTTLLKIIAGLVEPDGGEIFFEKGTVLGYVPQDTSLNSNETIGEYVYRVSGMDVLEERMQVSPEAMIEYERRDGYTFHHRLSVMLSGFGLDNISTERSISSLSSGQKSKVFIVGVLLSDPDILLLDEPTNNLDLPALVWLEDFLSRTGATCIIVSHDRLFLDRIVRKIFEIDWRTRSLSVTNGRYSDYLLRKDKDLVRQKREYVDQQEEIKRLEEQVKKKKQESLSGSRYKGTDNDKFLRGFKRDRAGKSGKQAKAIEKRIEQMEVVERPVERDVFRIHLQPSKPSGNRDINIQNLVAGYANSQFRIGPISLFIPYGSRVVFLGLNGTGKTTLLHTMSGNLPPIEGCVTIGNALVVGNLTQEHNNLPRTESIKSFLLQKTSLSVQEIYSLAVKYGFVAEEIDKKIEVISPGGRARLLFALFSAISVNVLLLDEPTNHLDLEAVEALEEVVTHYEGTIVLISHDRRFLEKFLPTDVYVLSDGCITRQESFDVYVKDAERHANRLIKLI